MKGNSTRQKHDERERQKSKHTRKRWAWGQYPSYEGLGARAANLEMPVSPPCQKGTQPSRELALKCKLMKSAFQMLCEM